VEVIAVNAGLMENVARKSMVPVHMPDVNSYQKKNVFYLYTTGSFLLRAGKWSAVKYSKYH